KTADVPEGLTPHELRHTCASLAIRSGANVKVVQRMLGHSSAALTLDRYGHLFDDDLDAVADALGDLRRKECGQNVGTATGWRVCVVPEICSELGAPERIRTPDQPGRNRMLYPLSYGGLRRPARGTAGSMVADPGGWPGQVRIGRARSTFLRWWA